MSNSQYKIGNNSFYDLLQKILNRRHIWKTRLWYSLFFYKIGQRSKIIKPLKLNNPRYITIGNRVTINKHSWLFTLKINDWTPQLIIEDDCNIGHFSHFTCVHKVHIQKSVIIADKVYISDNTHSYENPTIPIQDQPILVKKEVVIGEGSWIGESVTIIGCKIGRNCVIGANSVVTKDIPDYCIAAGIPAKIIKKYDFDKKIWYESRK